MGDKPAHLERKSKVMRNLLIPCMDSFLRGEVVKRTIYFKGIKMACIIGKIISSRKMGGIEYPFPFLITPT